MSKRNNSNKNRNNKSQNQINDRNQQNIPQNFNQMPNILVSNFNTMPQISQTVVSPGQNSTIQTPAVYTNQNDLNVAKNQENSNNNNSVQKNLVSNHQIGFELVVPGPLMNPEMEMLKGRLNKEIEKREAIEQKYISTLEERNTKINQLEKENQEFREQLKRKDQEIEELRNQLKQKDQQIELLQKEIQDLKQENKEIKRQYKDISNRVSKLEIENNDILLRKLCNAFEVMIIEEYFGDEEIDPEYETLNRFFKLEPKDQNDKKRHDSILKKYDVNTSVCLVVKDLCKRGTDVAHEFHKEDFIKLNNYIDAIGPKYSKKKDTLSKILSHVMKNKNFQKFQSVSLNTKSTIKTISNNNNNNNNNNTKSQKQTQNLIQKSIEQQNEKIDIASKDPNEGFIFRKNK